MDFTSYILDNALILIPVLVILGAIIKNTQTINDKYIPVILLVFGIVGAISLMGLNANAVIQGILVTGTAVYCNQVYKQSKK